MLTPDNQLSRRNRWILAILVLLSLAAHAQEQAARQVVVSIPDRKIALVENGEVVRIYPVAVGKDSTPSPTGTFTIKNRLTNPTYYHPGTVIEPGPLSPIGTRWIGLSQKGFGIHGTNEPQSIGKAASHGCIRMARKDLEELFTLVQIGDTVEIHGERDEQIAKAFGGTQTVITASAATPAAPSVNGQ